MDGALQTARRGSRLPAWNVLLFAATVATTVLSGAAFAGWSGGGTGSLVLAGLSYATAILAILFAHEMGHYLLARAWRVDSTLPYFLPIFVPGSLNFGTLGALIRLRSPIPSREAVLDIGAAGPLAGALVAVPLYAWGLAHSKVQAVGSLAPSGEKPIATTRGDAAAIHHTAPARPPRAVGPSVAGITDDAEDRAARAARRVLCDLQEQLDANGEVR